ncbi:MAG: transglycosylase family protein [Thermoleophilaceae bacterium]
MRKLLVSATAAALVASPAAIAFAADEPTLDEPTLDTKSHRHLRAEQLDVSRAKYKLAAHRVAEEQDNRRARIVERREDRREAAEAAAEAAAAEAAAAEAAAAEVAAPAPVSSGSTASGELSSIAECESGGDYSTDTGNGFYGAYQFTPETWAGVGGSGLPSEASPEEQDMRAQMLLEQSGTSPWPVCGG